MAMTQHKPTRRKLQQREDNMKINHPNLRMLQKIEDNYEEISKPNRRMLQKIEDNSAMEEKHDLIATRRKNTHICLEDLLSKKSSVREDVLRALVEKFESNVCCEYAKKLFVTLTYRCQNCIKKGPTLEIDLALQLIGLIAITLGSSDAAHEIFEDSLIFLPKLLVESKSSNWVKVIECLSIVTLVGARDFGDTERSMEVIWKFMSNQESKSKGKKHPSSVTAAAIKGWSLLLSNINKRDVDHKKWKGFIPYILRQLEAEEDDKCVNAASIEALALIFEDGSPEKFSNQAGEYSNLKDFKDDTMKQVKRACNGTKEDAMKILDDDYKTTTLTLCERTLTFSTWSQVKQLNFIRRFLGLGFANHMNKSEYLHKIFHFESVEKCSDLEPYTPEFEEVVVGIFIHDVRRKNCTKRINMSPNSLLSKGRTKLMNKYRSIAEDNKGHNMAAEEL